MSQTVQTKEKKSNLYFITYLELSLLSIFKIVVEIYNGFLLVILNFYFFEENIPSFMVLCVTILGMIHAADD